MIHLELAKQILELDTIKLSEILEELEQINPDFIEELREKIWEL
jgi:hypothetical protein